jgi:RNA polymerase sigma factor (sigma-70 family)
MAAPEQDFQQLLEQIQSGVPDAAQRFIDRFGQHILRVIRRRLEKKLRPKFDSCDFLQDVLASFFLNPPPPSAFASPDALFAFLTTMARNKVVEKVRQRLVLKRYNVNREHSLDGSARYLAGDLEGQEPTPSEVAVAKEQWSDMLRDQPDHYRQILDLLRQGFGYLEIAQKLNLSAKMVQRLVNRLQPRYAP